jgi:signal transduction histidine kinase
MAYRIAILYLFSVLALLALLGAGVYYATEQTLVGGLAAELQRQADADAQVLGALTADDTALVGTAQALAPALAGGRSQVRIFNANGALVAGTTAFGTRPSILALGQIPPRLLTLGVRAENMPGRLYTVSAVRAGGTGAIVAVVEVSQTRAEIDRVLAGLGQAFVLAGLAAGVLALAAGVLLARSIVAPVRRLERVAAAIAGGDLARRVTGLPRNELGALGASFNQMAERLAGLLAQARAEQERLTAILAGLADGVLACDAAGQITLENPAAREVLGVPSAAPAAALADACATLGLTELWARAMRGDAPVEMEISPPGRSVLAVAAPVRAGGEAGRGCVCVLRDITAVRETEQGRAAVLRRLGHELRTPLTALQAVVSNLADDAPAAQAPALAVLEEETARLARLVEELLALARGPTTTNLELRPLDLRTLAAAATALFATRAERLGITVSTSAGDTPVIVRGVPDRLRQVLVNLLDNALRFTPAGGQVTVGVQEGGAEAVLTVADTGAGMDAVTSRWAFEPYYQGTAPAGVPGRDPIPDAPASRGSGLGLAIVREIVSAHGGRLSLDTARDAGPTITVALPLL